jgi:hypothetical protein
MHLGSLPLDTRALCTVPCCEGEHHLMMHTDCVTVEGCVMSDCSEETAVPTAEGCDRVGAEQGEQTGNSFPSIAHWL